MQGKFAERLKRLESEGHMMPTFKDIVDFLKERAFVLNHPFFSRGSGENVSPKVKFRIKPPQVNPKVPVYVNMTSVRGDYCPMCRQAHRLYQCETFKSKSPKDSSLHNSKKCKSLIRCKVQGCGKAHHTLLHFAEPKENVNRETVDQNIGVKQNSVPDQGTLSTVSSAASDSCDVFLQVIPVKVISNSGNQITTYGLIDSGSDIKMIDPSIVKLLNIEGAPSKLTLTTVNNADVEEGVKVNFKIAPVDSQNDHVLNVNSAWAVKDLTIPLKHTKLSKSVEQCPHLRQVSFPEVERKKISILLGTNIQEVFIPLDVRRGKPNDPIAIKSCLGWSILGAPQIQGLINLVTAQDVSLDKQLEEFWKVESYGTARPESKPLSVEDRRALKLIENSICLRDGHYQMGVLWKDDNTELPYNRSLAEAREVLQSIPPDLRANPLLDLDLDQLPLERALGVYWDAQSDTFKCYKSQFSLTPSTIQLHNFADASRCGYAAVSYLRFVNERGVTHRSFVMGKTRNAPIREWTIPRLELQAAVLATRLSKMIVNELDLQVDQTFFWSDSMTSLQYIKNETKRFQTFVANRVAEIHETSSPEQWHHIPGTMNPADDGSRGVGAQYFHAECRWWSGPKFLWEPEHMWPNAPVEDLEEDDNEIRKLPTVMFVSSASQIDVILQRYSSWSRLIKVMSWVLRFVQRSRKKAPAYLKASTLQLVEIQQTSQEIVRLVQSQHFHEEYLCLKEGRQVKCNSKLANLSPILIDGVIRVGGRIHRAPIAFKAAHPMVLPKSHHVSMLIVRYYHYVLGHAGREHVLSVIRQSFWILRGRSLVRQILRKCVSCRRRNAPTLKQVMADLPKERLVPYQPPFTYTGLDFFGPFYVKRSRSTAKVYGCIFVCFNSRAIHIEDVSLLETDTFIQALLRFISVRGCPKEIWSDNGTNFTGAEKELRLLVQGMSDERIKSELHSREVEW
ncbi:hypothetical protein P5673_015113 [Acropora cervicornis]|uniref:Integrase zinc-binding domain-containing protein n=1 Tax=Acropora cervicornis TaxID=6130 RepID=A0AAD9V5E0_ACRCE|nr:hypothetical protein P5673_015113 [Acropora cervicornis]